MVSLGVPPFLFRTVGRDALAENFVQNEVFFIPESSGTITHDVYAHKVQFSDAGRVNDEVWGERTCFM